MKLKNHKFQYTQFAIIISHETRIYWVLIHEMLNVSFMHIESHKKKLMSNAHNFLPHEEIKSIFHFLPQLNNFGKDLTSPIEFHLKYTYNNQHTFWPTSHAHKIKVHYAVI